MGSMSAYPPPEPSWDASLDPTRQHHVVVADERNWSVAAHLGSFVTFLVRARPDAPLVVLLVREGAPRSAPARGRVAELPINAVYSVVFAC